MSEGPQGPPATEESTLANLMECEVVHPVECAVCFDELCIGDIGTELPCSHIFHKDCVTPWLERHATCPSCRGPLHSVDASWNQSSMTESTKRYPPVCGFATKAGHQCMTNTGSVRKLTCGCVWHVECLSNWREMIGGTCPNGCITKGSLTGTVSLRD